MITLKDKERVGVLRNTKKHVDESKFVFESKDVKQAVLEFEKELKELTYQTSKEDYIISIIKCKTKFNQIFGDFEK